MLLNSRPNKAGDFQNTIQRESLLYAKEGKNPGILEAVKEVKVMSLRKGLRALYEGHMREIRDRYARDEYVREEGKAEGRAETILELLEELGAVSEELRKAVMEQRDKDVLKEWLKLAARAESVEEFQRKCKI